MLDLVFLGLLLMLVVLCIYVKYPWIPDWAILLGEVLMIPVFVDTQLGLTILLVTAIIGYVSEWLGVRTQIWNYRKNNVPVWISLAWGFIVVVIYYAAQVFSFNALILAPLVILFSFMLDMRIGALNVNLLSLLNSILVLFLFRERLEIFVFAYLISQFVEYFGAVFFKVWEYRTKISFVAIGFGYAIIVWLSLTTAEVLIGAKSLVLQDVGLALFFILSVVFERLYNQ